MPQVWVSYDELASHYECSTAAAREQVHLSGWSRRRCSDGLTRVKLPAAVMADYIRRSWQPVPDGIATVRLPPCQKGSHRLQSW